MCVFFFFFKQKTAYELRISDWSSDVCSSDLFEQGRHEHRDSLISKPARHPGPRKFLCDDARLENVRLGSIASILLRDRSRGIPMLDQQLLPFDRLGRRSGRPVSRRRREMAMRFDESPHLLAEDIVFGPVIKIHNASNFPAGRKQEEIGRAYCREGVCQYV